MKAKNQENTELNKSDKKSQWWASRSLVTLIKKRPTKIFGKKASVVYSRLSVLEKHTFFPGNEINRVRIEQVKDKLLILPDSHLKALWDAIIIAISLIIAFTVPYGLSYGSDLGMNGFYFITTVFYLIDLLIQLNTGYSDKGHIVVSRSKIWKRYLSTWLLVDLLSCLPLNYLIPSMDFAFENSDLSLSSQNPLRYLWLLKLLKSLKFYTVTYRLKYLYTFESLFTLIDIFSTLFIVSICTHWIACIYNLLYIYSLENGDSQGYGWNDNKTKHLHFIHRCVQTIASVGYGDTHISTVPERLTAALAMIITSGLMGYFVGNIRSAIEKSNQNDNYYRDIIMKFKKYSSHKNLSKKLKSKVLNYYRHLKELNRNNQINEGEVLKIISLPLKTQIILIVRGFILTKLNIFSRMSKGCTRVLGDKMKICIYSPYDRIIKQGELTNTLYMITSGTIEIYHEKTNTSFAELSEGHLFGEISFFTGEPRKSSARTTEYSELFCLSKFDFIETIGLIPKDREIFDIYMRNYRIYGFSILGISCYLCKSKNHIANDCPDYSSKVHINRIIQKYYARKKNISPCVLVNAPILRKRERPSVLNRYNVANVKGREADYISLKGESRLSEMIRKEYLPIYSRKRFSKYMSSDSDKEDPNDQTIDHNMINPNPSKRKRSSTFFPRQLKMI